MSTSYRNQGNISDSQSTEKKSTQKSTTTNPVCHNNKKKLPLLHKNNLETSNDKAKDDRLLQTLSTNGLAHLSC